MSSKERTSARVYAQERACSKISFVAFFISFHYLYYFTTYLPVFPGLSKETSFTLIFVSESMSWKSQNKTEI